MDISTQQAFQAAQQAEQQNRVEDAARIYDYIVQMHPNTDHAQQAQQNLMRLRGTYGWPMQSSVPPSQPLTNGHGGYGEPAHMPMGEAPPNGAYTENGVASPNGNSGLAPGQTVAVTPHQPATGVGGAGLGDSISAASAQTVPSAGIAKASVLDAEKEMANYGVGRFVAGLVFVLGWLLILGCISVAGFSYMPAAPVELVAFRSMILPGAAGGVVVGLLFVMLSQQARAGFDAARASQATLLYLRRAAEGD